MIGISLVSCVSDIADGKVSIDQVEKIVVGEACRDSRDWDQVIHTCRILHWHQNPDKYEAVLRELLATNKIFQPRLLGGTPPKYIHWCNGVANHWVNAYQQIEYWPANPQR